MANQWDKLLTKNNNKLKTVAKELTRSIANRIIDTSPVDTGRFKFNWHTELNIIDDATDDLKIPGTYLATKTEELKLDDSIYFTNSLDYAKKLEFGFSKQAPLGMVRVSVAQFELNINKIALGLNT